MAVPPVVPGWVCLWVWLTILLMVVFTGSGCGCGCGSGCVPVLQMTLETKRLTAQLDQKKDELEQKNDM